MTTEEQPNAAPHMRLNHPPPSLLSKFIAFILGAGFLVLAFMFSLVALAVVAVAGIMLGGWLRWSHSRGKFAAKAGALTALTQPYSRRSQIVTSDSVC